MIRLSQRIKKIIIPATMGIIAVIAIAALAMWQISRSRTFQFFGEIVARVDTSEPVIALTFDDGPTPRFTDEILAVLREKRVRATFFVTGREVEANMNEARRITGEGHELGNHSYSHRRMMFVSPSFIRNEIERTDELIRRAGYEGRIHFRPPYTKKLLFLPFYLNQTGRITVTCDIEPESNAEIARDSNRIVADITANARPGSIILLHVMYESRAESLEAVPRVIDELRNRGYRFVTVSELLAAR
jgi:peptidoglycan-N-acetylglucosamine deacetylase